MDTLIKKIKDMRGLKDNTLKNYSRNLKILSKEMTGEEFKDLDFLEDFEGVKEFLKENKISTRKNKTASLITALKTDPEKYKDVIKKYEDYLFKINEEYDKIIDSNKKSLRESDNWVSLDELKDVWNGLRKKVVIDKISKKTDLDNKDRRLLQNFVICSLYILEEPRRNTDYSEMKFIKKSIYDGLPEDTKESNNYLIYDTDKVEKFSFGNYKTAKKYKVQVFPISKKLKVVLNMWLKHRKKDQQYLLLNNRGNKMTSNSLTKKLWEIFSATGKDKIGCCMLRHIYITEDEELKEYRDKRKKAEEKAKKMAHSLETQQKYYRK